MKYRWMRSRERGGAGVSCGGIAYSIPAPQGMAVRPQDPGPLKDIENILIAHIYCHILYQCNVVKRQINLFVPKQAILTTKQ